MNNPTLGDLITEQGEIDGVAPEDVARLSRTLSGESLESLAEGDIVELGAKIARLCPEIDEPDHVAYLVSVEATTYLISNSSS